MGFERVLRGSQVPANNRHLVRGYPSDVVMAVAERLHSDIVVMGAVSRLELKRVFIGNTAERLLERLSCDLLVVKPAEFVSHLALERREPGVLESAVTG